MFAKRKTEEERGRVNGGRNLAILGISAIIIAILTTSISLSIYRATGDIYLDRSRPGYITKGEKHNTEDDGGESFASEGKISDKVIDEYLKEFDEVKKRVDAASDDFSPEPLSDDSLSISVSDEVAEPEVGGAGGQEDD